MTDREAWLIERRNGIGASDVAAILGISPWGSPYSTFADKVGLTDLDDEMTERQAIGLALEPGINRLFHQRTGLYVAGTQTMIQHPELPWARATLDGYVTDTPPSQQTTMTIATALGTFESKTAMESPKAWEAAIPDHYMAQVQWQLFVSGAEHAWVGCLHANFGLSFRVYEVHRDEADVQFIVEQVTRFWNDHVLTGIPPEGDSHPATTNALRYLEDMPGKTADLSEHASVLRALRRDKAELKRYEQLVAEGENTLKALLGEATDAYIDGELAFTWRRNKDSEKFDTDAFRKAWPDLAAQFTKTTQGARVLRIPKEKE